MKITTEEVWKRYWRNKKIVKVINTRYWFNDLFKKYLYLKKYHNFIEIGGYPGYFAIYFKKYWDYDVTLLDYIIDQKIIRNLLKANGLKPNDINTIKRDFLLSDEINKYDVVYSFGFIEHFDNPGIILKKHWKLVKKDGTMIIIYPNLLGINGVVQKIFDPENLKIHNLKIMDIKSIKSQLKKAGIKCADVFYYGGFGVWLERLNERNIFIKALIYGLSAVGKLIKLFRLNSKLTSPHIVIVAIKS